MAWFLIPSAVLLVASKTPVTGLMTKPAIPWAVPLKKPVKPPDLIPSMGFVNNPVTPFSNPESKVTPAYWKPYPIFFAFLAFNYYLCLIYSSSKESPANPDPKDPVILFNVFNEPDKVFFIKEPAPYKIPKPPSNGPFTNPSCGLFIKSYKPEPMFENNPTGFPMNSILPIKKSIYLIKSFLYLIISFPVIP